MSKLAGLLLVCATAAAVVAPVASPATSNPCKLVTAANARSALGAAVGKPALHPAGVYQSCTYTTKSGKRLVVLTRKVSKSIFTKSAKANPGPVKAVAGLGGSAYSVAGGFSLLVWKRGTEVALSIYATGQTLPAMKVLAKKVAARL